MDWLLQHHEEIRNLGLVGAAASGLPLAIWRSFIAQQQTRIATDNHLAETYTKAIDQIGKTEDEIRLGGLYALEKIAQSNRQYHGQIIEVLCAFVRLHAPLEEENDDFQETTDPSPKLIVQTTLTLIGRRNIAFERLSRLQKTTVTIDLSNTNLSKARLFKANLSRVNLLGANLSGAYLLGTNLKGAIVTPAKLREAKVYKNAILPENIDRDALTLEKD